MTGLPPLRYVLSEHPLAVSGHRLVVIGLADFEQTVTELADRAIALPELRPWFEELCPMFGTVWPSALALAAVLARTDLRSRAVLELGCGLAVPSMVAALGGAHVVATDQHPDTAAFLERNLARNGLSRVTYRPVDWRGESGPEEPTVPARAFDVVCASDVLYAADMPALVAGAFARFLAPGGVGLLADPGRPWLQDFVGAAAERGLATAVDAEDEVFVLRITHVGGAGG